MRRHDRRAGAHDDTPSPKPPTAPTQPIERAVTAGLPLAVIAGLAWIVGMVYTLTGWAR